MHAEVVKNSWQPSALKILLLVSLFLEAFLVGFMLKTFVESSGR